MTNKQKLCSCDQWTYPETHKYACWMCDRPNGRQTRSEGKPQSHKPIQLTLKFKELNMQQTTTKPFTTSDVKVSTLKKLLRKYPQNQIIKELMKKHFPQIPTN